MRTHISTVIAGPADESQQTKHTLLRDDETGAVLVITFELGEETAKRAFVDLIAALDWICYDIREELLSDY